MPMESPETTSAQFYAPLTVIGLMSGTSVDSIDAACIQVQMGSNPLRLLQMTVLGGSTLDIPDTIKARLLTLMRVPSVSLAEICRLNFDLGDLFATAAQQLATQMKASGETVDLIASHGQTVFHIPPAVGEPGSTLQIGQPALIAARTGIEVAADFRPADMAAGGHGAPLVPFADKLLFRGTSIARAAQNIGGIANLTAIPALDQPEIPMMAFDTGPGNMVIDALMSALFGRAYDDQGKTAARGTVHPAMLATMLDNPYFGQAPPKSTGRELFGHQYAETLLAAWQGQVSPEDIIATATAFTAQTILDAYTRFVLPRVSVREVVVGGGGVYNQTLMRLLKEGFVGNGIALKRHEDFGINSKYKEAIAFALLGYARKMGIPNNVPACTGALHPVVMGGLWSP